MKKHVADLPFDVVTRALQMATRQAAANAVSAGLLVAGWENGRLTEYGLDAVTVEAEVSADPTKEGVRDGN